LNPPALGLGPFTISITVGVGPDYNSKWRTNVISTRIIPKKLPLK
jgi:hypothetical protein